MNLLALRHVCHNWFSLEENNVERGSNLSWAYSTVRTHSLNPLCVYCISLCKSTIVCKYII